MRKFTVLWSSQAASLLGSAVVQFALAWYLTRETGSATVLASALMVAMLPQVVLGPFAGPVVDTFGIRSLYFIAAGAWLLIASGALLSKSLMELEDGPATETPAAEQSPT
jgi:DHA3 family macrolide efflux protein-like MFS transporter